MLQPAPIMGFGSFPPPRNRPAHADRLREGFPAPHSCPPKLFSLLTATRTSRAWANPRSRTSTDRSRSRSATTPCEVQGDGVRLRVHPHRVAGFRHRPDAPRFLDALRRRLPAFSRGPASPSRLSPTGTFNADLAFPPFPAPWPPRLSPRRPLNRADIAPRCDTQLPLAVHLRDRRGERGLKAFLHHQSRTSARPLPGCGANAPLGLSIPFLHASGPGHPRADRFRKCG